MTALAKDRNTPFKGDNRQISMKVAASTQIYKGAILCVNAGGYLIPAADTAGLLVVGIAEENVDNTGGSNGDLSCIVQKGVAGLRAGSSTPVQADIGRAVYVEDDAGVETNSGSVNKIQAGILDSIVGDLFFVKIFDETAGDSLPVGSVGTAEIADDAVTAAKIDLFVSAETTATGASQDIPHGLGGVPTVVLVILSEFADTLAIDVAYGAHDATNVKVTVASAAKFKILAIL